MTVGFALAAALLYGAADFLGGLATRRTSAAAVVVVSQLAGYAVLAVALAALPGPFTRADLTWGFVAGFAGALSVVTLYAALAIGRMGAISPLAAAVGAVIPVAVGLGFGERPSGHVLAGVALAFVAVALISADESLRISPREPGIALGLLAGVGVGLLYVALAAQGHPGGGLGRLAVMRTTSVLLLLAYAAVRRESLRPAPGTLRVVVGAGLLDMGANIAYVLAARGGSLAIAAVLTSLYPASTVFLGRFVLGERLRATQWAGVGCALAAVALIAA